jgi:hypothetical protein
MQLLSSRLYPDHIQAVSWYNQFNTKEMHIQKVNTRRLEIGKNDGSDFRELYCRIATTRELRKGGKIIKIERRKRAK